MAKWYEVILLRMGASTPKRDRCVDKVSNVKGKDEYETVTQMVNELIGETGLQNEPVVIIRDTAEGREWACLKTSRGEYSVYGQHVDVELYSEEDMI